MAGCGATCQQYIVQLYWPKNFFMALRFLSYGGADNLLIWKYPPGDFMHQYEIIVSVIPLRFEILMDM